MPLISIILFFVLSALLLVLLNALKVRKKMLAVRAYGHDTYDIELPSNVNIQNLKNSRKFPSFLKQSDAEGFFLLVAPYIGSLSLNKREYLHQSIIDLKNALKINKEIYQYFIDEYKTYEGLNEEQAAEKWSGN